MFTYYEVQVTADVMTTAQKELIDDICVTLHIDSPYTQTQPMSQYEARLFISEHIGEYKMMKELYSEMHWYYMLLND